MQPFSHDIRPLLCARREVSRFIAAGRLHAKIDKTAGVIETNRPDPKTAHYKVGPCLSSPLPHSLRANARLLRHARVCVPQAVIKQGDLLLTKIQKFARTVSI